jgi:hypothetical protein
MHTVTHKGAFDYDNSGGSSDNADWYKNPKYPLDITVTGKYRVIVQKCGQVGLSHGYLLLFSICR